MNNSIYQLISALQLATSKDAVSYEELAKIGDRIRRAVVPQPEDGLHARVRELEALVRTANKTAEVMEAEAFKRKKEMTDLRHENNRLQERHDRRVPVYRRLRAEIGDLEKRLKDMTVSNRNYVKATEDRNAEIAAMSAQCPVGAFNILEGSVSATSAYIKDGEWPVRSGTLEVYARPLPETKIPESLRYRILTCGFMSQPEANQVLAELRAVLAPGWHVNHEGLK